MGSIKKATKVKLPKAKGKPGRPTKNHTVLSEIAYKTIDKELQALPEGVSKTFAQKAAQEMIWWANHSKQNDASPAKS